MSVSTVSEEIPPGNCIVVKGSTPSISLFAENRSFMDLSEQTAEMCCSNEVVRLLIMAVCCTQKGVCCGNDPNRFEDCKQDIIDLVYAFINYQILRRNKPIGAIELEATCFDRDGLFFEVDLFDLTPTVSEKNGSSVTIAHEYTVSTFVDFCMFTNQCNISVPYSSDCDGRGDCSSGSHWAMVMIDTILSEASECFQTCPIGMGGGEKQNGTGIGANSITVYDKMSKADLDNPEKSDESAYADKVYRTANMISAMMDQCGFKESAFFTDVAFCVLCIRMLKTVPVKACRIPSDRIAPILERVEGIASDILLRELEHKHASIDPACQDVEITVDSPELTVHLITKCNGKGCGKTSCNCKADTCTDYNEDVTDREVPDYNFITLEDK